MTSSALSASPVRFALFAVIGICVLTASSYVSVPMYPVPVTMQTLAVLVVGAVAGPRLGAAIVISWLAMAMAGAPVLAGGKMGLAAFAGPTAGFLASFPVAAFLAGYVVRAGHPLQQFAGFLAVHTLILAMGWAWLASLIGAQAAFAAGVAPFLIGAALKSGLAASFLAVLPKRA